MAKAWRRIRDRIVDETVGGLLTAGVLSVGATIVGWLENFSPYALMVGFIFIFCQAGLLAMRFHEWRRKNNPEHKLNFTTTTATFGISENGKPMIYLGIRFSSSAEFPLYFRVRNMRSRLDKLHSPHIERRHKINMVPVNGSGFANDFEIEIDDRESYTNRVVSGNIECEIEYGKRDDSMPYVLALKKQIKGTADTTDNISHTWSDGPN